MHFSLRNWRIVCFENFIIACSENEALKWFDTVSVQTFHLKSSSLICIFSFHKCRVQNFHNYTVAVKIIRQSKSHNTYSQIGLEMPRVIQHFRNAVQISIKKKTKTKSNRVPDNNQIFADYSTRTSKHFCIKPWNHCRVKERKGESVYDWVSYLGDCRFMISYRGMEFLFRVAVQKIEKWHIPHISSRSTIWQIKENQKPD